MPEMSNAFEFDKENIACPKSPEKSVRTKRHRKGLLLDLLRLIQPKAVPPISELGPDALLEPMKLDQFVDSLGKKKIAIKALLLDQEDSWYGSWAQGQDPQKKPEVGRQIIQEKSSW